MKNLLAYARVINNDECNNYCKVLDITQLHPVDSLKIVAEQYILADYLRRTGNPARALDITSIANDLHVRLPSRISGHSTVYDNVYGMGLEILSSLRNQTFNKIDPIQLRDIFDLSPDVQYDPQLYTHTLPMNFLYIWMNLALNFMDETIFPEQKMYGAPFLLPEIRACYTGCEKKEGKGKECHHHCPDKWQCILEFTPFIAGRYEIGSKTTGLMNIAEHYSFPDIDFGRFLGLLSHFSLERDKYDMTNSTPSAKLGIQDVCFDLVSSNLPVSVIQQTTTYASIGQQWRYDLRNDIDTFVRMVDSGKLIRVSSENENAYRWIAPLLYICGADRKLVSYFTKPASAISASENFSFEQSAMSKLCESRIVVGLEADEPSLPDTAGGSDNASGQNDMSSGGDDPFGGDMDMGGDDAGGEGNQEGDEGDNGPAEPIKDANRRPEIDPKMMILELTSPAVALSDYLYRDLVSRRISYILKNPPANARPEVLQLLRTWNAQWLFLVSIPTIRDFLSRIAIRLS